jgi:hypothetical protein
MFVLPCQLTAELSWDNWQQTCLRQQIVKSVSFSYLQHGEICLHSFWYTLLPR